MTDAPVAVPEKRKPGRPSRADIAAREAALTDAQAEALDRDNDGSAGGSLPHKLPEREITALCREAWEAFDMQDQRQRDDSLRRRWTFAPSQQLDHAGVLIRCERGVDGRSEFIRSDRLGIDSRHDDIRACVEALIENV